MTTIPLYAYREGEDRQLKAIAFIRKYYGDKKRDARELRDSDSHLYRALWVELNRNKLAGRKPDTLQEVVTVSKPAHDMDSLFGEMRRLRDLRRRHQMQRGPRVR